MSPITLVDNESVLSLHAFIFSDEPSRARYIYGLRIPGPYIYENQVADRSVFDNSLVALFAAAVHIQYLHFPTSIKGPVFDAVMKLTTLRELHAVSEDTRRPLLMRLPTFQSPLRSLCIEECDTMGDNISALFLHEHLSHLAPTLEELDLDFFQFNIAPSSITTPFLALTSLAFATDYITFEFHPTAILLCLFPNLRGTLVIVPMRIVFIHDYLSALREHSVEEQRARAWPGLDRLVCDAEWAFVLALQCPIRRMDIHIARSDGKGCLADTLRSNAPRHLHLTVGLKAHEVWDVLDGLFPAEAADRLTHLVILVEFEVYSKWRSHLKGKRVPWNRLFNKVVDSVGHLRPTHLRIVLECTVLQGVPNSFPDGQLVNAAYEVSEPDLLCVAARLMDTMPTLECLFLDAHGETYTVPVRNDWEVDEDQTPHVWHLSKGWRFVHRDPDEVPVGDISSPGPWTELAGEAVERVAEEAELRLARFREIRQWRNTE
ncbi:hypothetical protein GSI_05784 [Ganoderma sinense ZZ0214-1]|uniref:F-box domain-containing protein n=1 Tax=Ganoderma sinense ZZ0214-1 TaxID=1077348 RepID=A0A2G8SBW4_9APHY|nr:hypothetical protein GSI_05784 [Ganoderma sinense ZZ0214-1]